MARTDRRVFLIVIFMIASYQPSTCRTVPAGSQFEPSVIHAQFEAKEVII
jgi:hypothetical protein